MGVVGNRYSGEVTLQVADDRDLTDVLLGLKPGRAVHFATLETRWGITLPTLESLEPAEVSFTATPQKGTVTLINRKTREMARVSVNVIVPPVILRSVNQRLKIWLKSDTIDFLIEELPSSYNVSANFLADAILSLVDLLQLNKSQRILTSGDGSFELRIGKRPAFKSRLKVGDPTATAASFQNNFELLTMLNNLVEAAFYPTQEFCLLVQELNSQIDEIVFLNQVIQSPNNLRFGPFTFNANRDFGSELPEREGLLLFKLRFQNNDIAACMIGRFGIISESPVRASATVTSLRLREIEIIDSAEQAYHEFNERMLAETGLSISLISNGRDEAS